MATFMRAREVARCIALSGALLVLPTFVADAAAKQLKPPADRDHTVLAVRLGDGCVMLDAISDVRAAPLGLLVSR